MGWLFMKRAVAIAVSVVISAFLGWLLLRSVPASALIDALSHVSVFAIAVGFLMAMVMAVVDGVRYWELDRKSTRLNSSH